MLLQKSEHCPNLDKLDIRGVLKYSDNYLRDLQTSQRKSRDPRFLLDENLYNCEDEAIPSLKFLRIGQVRSSQTNLTFKLTTTPNLELLSVTNCSLGSSLKNLAKECPNLRSLHIFHCTFIIWEPILGPFCHN